MTELIEAEVRRHLETWANEVGVPPVPDIAALEQEGRGRVLRRRGWIAAAAAAVVVLVVVTSVSWALRDVVGMKPAPPIVTPTAPPVTNGRIVNPYKHFAEAISDCSDCRIPFAAFDPDSGKGLFLRAGRVIVADVDGRLADIPCSKELACQSDLVGATLGPHADEVTLVSKKQKVRVFGYDGTIRRTLDLSAGLGRDEIIRELAWSPDRRRLAISTWKTSSSGRTGRVLLFDRDGGAAQLVYTTPTFQVPDCRTPVGVVYDLTWSPDGTRIGVIEYHTRTYCQTLIDVGPHWRRLIVLRLPPAGQTGSATAQRFPPQTHGAALEFAWSPDGTRIAVTVTASPKVGVLELSAEEGRVLARHPGRGPHAVPCCSPMIWLQRHWERS